MSSPTPGWTSRPAVAGRLCGRPIRIWLWLMAACLPGLVACHAPEALFDGQMPDMEAIYRQHFEMTEEDRLARFREGCQRIQQDSIPVRLKGAELPPEDFQQLPNPTLLLYVPPHFVGQDGLPVPGYTTSSMSGIISPVPGSGDSEDFAKLAQGIAQPLAERGPLAVAAAGHGSRLEAGLPGTGKSQ